MTPEGQAVSALLSYGDALNALLSERPWIGYGAAVVAGVGLLYSSGSRPPSASVRPRPALSEEGGTADARDAGGAERSARPSRAERVGGRRREEPPPRGWAVDGLVPDGPRPRWRLRWGLPPWRWERRGYVTCVLGSGGTGKSYVLLDLALAALADGPWLGRPVRPVRSVLYVDTELDAEECRRRAFPLARGRGLRVPPRGLHYLHLSASLASEEGQAVVRREARRVRAGLILVDSVTIGSWDVAAADANGWNRVYSGMEAWGPPVVAIDHMDKAGKDAYGSMMKQAKVRSLLRMTPQRDGAIRVEHAKSNFGPKSEPFTVSPSFGEGPGAATSFSASPVRPFVEEPADDDEREEAPERARPVPLRLVPRLARDGVCQAILGHLRTSGTRGPWQKAQLRDELGAAGVIRRSACYAHLAHLIEDGWLVDDGGGRLSLGEGRKEHPA